MSFPNTRILPRGSKLRLTQDYLRYSLNDEPIEPIKAGTILTVYQDYGAGRLNVFQPDAGLSEIVYLYDGEAEVVFDAGVQPA